MPVRGKQIFALLLSLLLMAGIVIPAFATGEETAPPPPPEELAFTAELILDEKGYAIWGNCPDLPDDAENVLPMISEDGGVTYESMEDYYAWVSGASQGICSLGNDWPLQGFLWGELDSLWVKLEFTDENGTTRYTQAAQMTTSLKTGVPDEPPAFETELFSGTEGTVLLGKFTAFTPEIKSMQVFYSLDGTDYHPVLWREDLPDMPQFWDLSILAQHEGVNSLFRQTCFQPHMEPLASYLDKDKDVNQFFVRLSITTWAGETYDSQVSHVRRDVVETPLFSKAEVSWPGTVLGRDDFPFFGKVCVTAREGMTAGELEALLPETLPITIELKKDSSPTPVDRGVLSYPVEWTLPKPLALTAGEKPVVFRNAATPPVIPPGQTVQLEKGTYTLPEGGFFETSYMSDEVRLSVTVLPEGVGPDIRLYGETEPCDFDSIDLMMALWEKPSGATAIRYFYCREGMEEWVEAAGELLTQAPVNATPNTHPSERYTLFIPEQSPYREFLAGESDGFVVGIEVEGGVFDGALATAQWPVEYEMPPHIPDFNGSGGNENNVGGGDGGPDGDSSTSGGQRPDLPDNRKPRPTPSPIPTVEPPPTPSPTAAPTPESPPTVEPTPEPTAEPTAVPVVEPVPLPSPRPTTGSKPTSPPPPLSVPTPAPTPASTTPPGAESSPTPSALPSPSPSPIPLAPPATPVERTPQPPPVPLAAIAVTVGAGAAATVTLGTVGGRALLGKIRTTLKNLFKRK